MAEQIRLRVGLSTCSKPADEDFFRACAEAGISSVEISPKTGAHKDVEFAGVKRLADCYGVELWSFHLPFMPFSKVDISSLDPSVRKNSVDDDAELIKRAADAGVKTFVIHPSGEPILPSQRAERMKASLDSLALLAPVAVSAGGVLAAEDLPRTCLGRDSDEIKTLFSADESLRVCFDTNHLLSENPLDFIKAVGDRIVTLHVSDYDFIDEKHWLPGEGDVDWTELYGAITAAGYRGPWMYEVGFGKPELIERGRGLEFSDFVNNAAEIFSGNKPSRI